MTPSHRAGQTTRRWEAQRPGSGRWEAGGGRWEAGGGRLAGGGRAGRRGAVGPGGGRLGCLAEGSWAAGRRAVGGWTRAAVGGGRRTVGSWASGRRAEGGGWAVGGELSVDPEKAAPAGRTPTGRMPPSCPARSHSTIRLPSCRGPRLRRAAAVAGRELRAPGRPPVWVWEPLPTAPALTASSAV